jgi:hypothetical protein
LQQYLARLGRHRRQTDSRAAAPYPQLEAGQPTGEYCYPGAVANRDLELIGKHVGVRAFADRFEHSGPDGGPIKTEEGSNLELARWIAFELHKADRAAAAKANLRRSVHSVAKAGPPTEHRDNRDSRRGDRQPPRR